MPWPATVPPPPATPAGRPGLLPCPIPGDGACSGGWSGGGAGRVQPIWARARQAQPGAGRRRELRPGRAWGDRGHGVRGELGAGAGEVQPRERERRRGTPWRRRRMAAAVPGGGWRRRSRAKATSSLAEEPCRQRSAMARWRRRGRQTGHGAQQSSSWSFFNK
jgi:hypothetical protein